MQWQDIVFTSGIIIMCLALIPSIIGSNKPQLTTSIVTAVVLAVFAVTYMSLELWFSAIVGIINCSLWLVLAYQRYVKNVDKAKV